LRGRHAGILHSTENAITTAHFPKICYHT